MPELDFYDISKKIDVSDTDAEQALAKQARETYIVSNNVIEFYRPTCFHVYPQATNLVLTIQPYLLM
jgi:hypothetical protein